MVHGGGWSGGDLSPSLTNLLDRAEPLTDETRAVLREMSPLNFVKTGLPPFLLIHGTEDKSVPCELVTIKGAPHRLTEWDKLDASYKEKTVTWLKQTLGAGKTSAAASARNR